MSMTSSSRVSILPLALLLSGCRVVAPDSPRPAPVQASKPRPAAPVSLESAELKSVQARRFDPARDQRFGRKIKAPGAAVRIDVRTARSLGNLAGSAAPVILVNGERLLDTFPIAQDHLVAIHPDRAKLREINEVKVVWLGRHQPETQRPLTFRLGDIR